MTTSNPAQTRTVTTVSDPSGEGGGLSEGQKRGLVIAAIVLLVIVALLVVGGVVLVQNPILAAAIRDVFIIFMALEFTVIAVALVVLMVQLAVLTNMLQHEIKPILESTNETVNTVRGTTVFLSENLVEPVIKLNAYAAMLGQLVESLGMFSRLRRKK